MLSGWCGTNPKADKLKEEDGQVTQTQMVTWLDEISELGAEVLGTRARMIAVAII